MVRKRAFLCRSHTTGLADVQGALAVEFALVTFGANTFRSHGRSAVFSFSRLGIDGVETGQVVCLATGSVCGLL